MNKNELIEKKKKERFDFITTPLKDVQLKAKPGTKPNLSLRIFELFYGATKMFDKEQWKINQMNKQQKERKEEIVNIIKKNDGLRGIISEKDNFNLTVYPSKHIVWNRDKLLQSLGKEYYSLVRENYTIDITLPSLAIRKKTKETIDKAIRKALISMGVSTREINKNLRTKININVDEQYLDELIQAKKVKLLPGTKKSEITWKIRLSPIRP